MNYEKIVMELFSRVKELEERVEELEDKIALNNNTIEEDAELENEDIKVTRSYSRQYVIEKLRENNPNLVVTKANRAMGSGILIKDKKSNKELTVKFYHSKSHNEECPSGWHTVNEEELINNDIGSFIFNLEYQKEFYTFIFTAIELKEYVKHKEKDQNNNYYFYFNIKEQKAIDYRDGEEDVTKYLNRWNIFSQII